MIELSPSYDSAISTYAEGLSIRFAGIPEIQIANDIYGLVDRHKGITMPSESQSATLIYDEDITPERQRLYYWLYVSPVFDIEEVAEEIAMYLNEQHELSVRLIFKSVNDEPDRVTVLEPARKNP